MLPLLTAFGLVNYFVTSDSQAILQCLLYYSINAILTCCNFDAELKCYMHLLLVDFSLMLMLTNFVVFSFSLNCGYLLE